MKILSTGSRNWKNKYIQFEYFSKVPRDTIVVHGGADGSDYFTNLVCSSIGLKQEIYLPNYAKYNAEAPLRRNDKMLDVLEEYRAEHGNNEAVVVAFKRGNSPRGGTQYTINHAHKRNLYVVVFKEST
jgi:hypothetical protein